MEKRKKDEQAQERQLNELPISGEDLKVEKAVDRLDQGELVGVIAEVEAGRLSPDQLKCAMGRHRAKQSLFGRVFGLSR